MIVRPIIAALGVLLGMEATGLAQVPPNPDRIRETTREILSRPEFRQFSRLKPGEPARGVSEMRTGRGLPRMKSSRGIPPGREKSEASKEPQRPNHRTGPDRLLENAPDGNQDRRNNRGNAEEALGREDFPEAGNLDRLLEGQNLEPDPIPRPDEDNNRNDPANNDPLAGGEDRALNDARKEDFDPGQPPPRNDNRAENPRRAGNQRGEENDEALPAPRPRERSADEAELGFSEPPVGDFARFVGAMFHFLAWGILAAICGLIVWLIIKAILEYERPYAFATGGADGSSLLDLEPERAPGDLPADAYVSQARQFAEAGRYREAVVQLVLGAMSRVERAGWVRFRRGMTVRDYLRGIRDYPPAYQGFRSMIRIFEPLAFGRREPKQEHFEQSLKSYETGFGSD